MSKDKTSVSLGLMFDRPPDAVNAQGVKWWADKSTTWYAKKPDANGTSFNVAAWGVETPDGYKTYVLTGDGRIIFEAQQLEAIGVHIDIMKLQKFTEQSKLDKDEED